MTTTTFTPFRDGSAWLAGRATNVANTAPLTAPFNDAFLADIHEADDALLDAALVAGTSATAVMRTLPRFARKAILDGIVAGIRAQFEAFVDVIVHEAGKPRKLAVGEVKRAISTFEAASAALLVPDERLLPLDGVEAGVGRLALLRRRPRGLVVAITPFNFPLNLVAHKLAPAIAAGCPVVLKPAEQTPLTSLLLARVCQDAGLPDGALSVVPCNRVVAARLVADERAHVVSFTGSAAAGFAIKAAAGKRHALLELGGNAAVIVCNDADLDVAAARIVAGAYAYAGQVCISVQRVLVDARVLPALRERLIAATAKVVCGDPGDSTVDVGPLIDDRAVARVQSVVDEAVAGGGRVLFDGGTDGRVRRPVLVEQPPAHTRLVTDEAFGPVCTLEAFSVVDDAFAAVNASRFGLQAGIFTNDVQTVLAAGDRLDVGAVIHDDVPTFRVDHMPYGGVKDSGSGREGLPWAIDEYTEASMLVLKQR
jgi:acyl-CoA reductase-like NAD-dependent aldehyde dehydrogenase